MRTLTVVSPRFHENFVARKSCHYPSFVFCLATWCKRLLGYDSLSLHFKSITSSLVDEFFVQRENFHFIYIDSKHKFCYSCRRIVKFLLHFFKLSTKSQDDLLWAVHFSSWGCVHSQNWISENFDILLFLLYFHFRLKNEKNIKILHCSIVQ